MFKKSGPYTGPVCYADGWHWSVKKDKNGYDVPDQKLFLEDNGTYRFAQKGDPSWHGRKHENYVDLLRSEP